MLPFYLCMANKEV